MKTLSRFVIKFTKLIVAVLSCFDRVIFKGYLPITNGQALEGFVDCVLKIRRCDFMAFAEEKSNAVVDYAKRLAQEAGAEYRFLQGFHRKDKLVDDMLRQRPIVDGLIGVLCCMETCPSFKLVYGKGRPRLVNARRLQRVLYFYFMDKELGQIYVRLTTWFPFTVQVYVNGHSWLEKQMLKRRIGFTLRDNAFTALDDPEAAQKLADSFGHLKWCKILNLYRYREVALAANERYLEALSVVENPAPAYRRIEKFTEPMVKAGRSYAGFNPASRSDVKLFEAVLDGNHVVRGFRNVDIREALHGTSADPVERRRQSAAVGRLLKRLHVRGLIRKVPRTRRWHVSPKGHGVLQGVLQLYHQGIPAALGTAA